MRIAIVGTGGVGGGFGAALAKAGANVSFIARGSHLAALRQNGLTIRSSRGNTNISPLQATDDPSDIGIVDLVLFCVKLWDVEAVARRIKVLIGPHTAAIPLQNGIDAADRLIPILGKHAVMAGVAEISACVAAPGLISQVGTFMHLTFGELDGARSERCDRFEKLCLSAEFGVTVSENIYSDLWKKFVMLASNASIIAAARKPLGELRDDSEISPLFKAAYQEVIGVGRACGIALPADVLERTLEFTRNAPKEFKPSMALDLERGNRLELPWLGGKVVQLAREWGIPTPVHSLLYAMLKPHIMGSAH